VEYLLLHELPEAMQDRMADLIQEDAGRHICILYKQDEHVHASKLARFPALDRSSAQSATPGEAGGCAVRRVSIPSPGFAARRIILYQTFFRQLPNFAFLHSRIFAQLLCDFCAKVC
jgi:hypothetical protein